MCYSGQPPPSPSPIEGGNGSGSQYALCALGVGLVALGVVMIVWSVVPSEIGSGNRPSWGGVHDAKGKTSSVAFILVGAGVAMLMLSICLGVRNKRRQERQGSQALDTCMQDRATEQGGATGAADYAARYDVPSYEEAVGSGHYPILQSNLHNSSSQLPSYDDLIEPRAGVGPTVDPGSETFATISAEATHRAQPGCQSGCAVHKLLPLRVRRIQSEKLDLDDHPALAGPMNIEPLTPPPQYEEKLPEL